MADQWGQVVYTVVKGDPRTHTFEFLNPISRLSKVVHHKLPVLPDCDGCSSLISSSPSAMDESEKLSTETFANCDYSLVATAHTHQWISQIPVEVGNGSANASCPLWKPVCLIGAVMMMRTLTYLKLVCPIIVWRLCPTRRIHRQRFFRGY